MRVEIGYGRQRAEFEVADERLVGVTATAPMTVTDDVADALKHALENPFEYPALRRALTPDDQIAILVDDRLPQLELLLTTLLEYVVEAGIAAENIALVCAPGTEQPWLEALPESLGDVRCEVHDPGNRKRLAFVTTTKRGKTLLFNRSAVDADQMIVLCGRRYDTLLGFGGGAGALYPTFADREIRKDGASRLSLAAPIEQPNVALEEAVEATWLLGAPFFVQVIEGEHDSAAAIVTGGSPALKEGLRQQELLWRRRVARPADVVVAGLSGNPAHQDFRDLADALVCASRVLKKGGAILLMSELDVAAAAATDLLRQADEPRDALREFERLQNFDLRAAWQWATVAKQARIFVLSATPDEIVEEIFATPVQSIDQAQRLVQGSKDCVFLPDAHKMLATVANAEGIT